MPDLIRYPVFFWIPASAGMTTLRYLTAIVISVEIDVLPRKKMGSRKLILLPQVLPMYTFDSAYPDLPYDASLCLVEPSHTKFHPCGYRLT
jgi:hypothetical protein